MHNEEVRALRRLFDGTRPFSALGFAALALGLVMLMSILLSPHGWQWWLDAKAVHGQELDGVVHYSFNGQSWGVDDPHSQTGNGPRTVYVIAADPAHGALVNTPTVIIDWAIVGGPGIVGAGLLAFGFVRRSQIRQRQSQMHKAGYDTHGEGIPSTLVRAIVAAREQGPRDPRLD